MAEEQKEKEILNVTIKVLPAIEGYKYGITVAVTLKMQGQKAYVTGYSQTSYNPSKVKTIKNL